VRQVDGGRVIRIDFDSNVHDTLAWKFIPTQPYVKVGHFMENAIKPDFS
jgi:cytochrome c oxidase assembly protein Cox11